jgi:hypothetical protein
MVRNDPRWVQHLDIITAWGEASAEGGTPPPTDQQLWAATRMRRDVHLPEEIGPVLLADLRAAYDAGRWPARIDLTAVAAAVNARGVRVRVLPSGGGTATLYTGEETVRRTRRRAVLRLSRARLVRRPRPYAPVR